MIVNWPPSFALVMKSEGGYVNDPDDPGGETNWGVTKSAWAEYLGRLVRPGEMKALTLAAVKPFYKSRYWDAVRGDDLPSGVDYMVFDFAVNAGVVQASKTLQRCVKADPDGKIGGHTLTLVNHEDVQVILCRFSVMKELFYRKLAIQRPASAKFLTGWLNRVDAVHAAAQDLRSATNLASSSQNPQSQASG